MNDESFVSAEYYHPQGSWLNYCQHSLSNLACASRYSGWLGQSEFQFMAKLQNHWQLGTAFQRPLGNSGLRQIELFWQQQALVPQLNNIGGGLQLFS